MCAEAAAAVVMEGGRGRGPEGLAGGEQPAPDARLAVHPYTAAAYCSLTLLFLSFHGRSGEKLDLDKERKVRTPQEMAAEAAELRKLLQ